MPTPPRPDPTPVGVLLAGGRGTRLAPLTDRTSKQLLPVGGRPLAARVIDQLTAAGVRDVLAVIDDRHADAFLGTLRDGRDLGLRSLAYVWQPPTGLGMPSAIAQVEPHVGDRPIVVICGDLLLEADLTGAVADFLDQPDGARLLATRVPDTAGHTPLRVAEGRVLDLGDKDPHRHRPGLMELGVYLYRRDVFDEIRALRPSARGETEIWELNRRYARRGRLRCTEVTGWWCDVGGSLADYREADRRYAPRQPTVPTGPR
ncbi:sugar phosphate nucleotidyltransferase [Micromonospora sp. WMMD1128]|uniref:sugar phosphate nucleotidyltransferase n=1 Tax=unclassified Micromonospora TaxID=2617518 RepID=UPI00248C4D99|nr:MULTISPECIES: sugar phosphate nucleotidyltransferase [unclassified Micromonospora]WBB75799.1 sugar phosphate nucleotidyltransferase [Micromonospora sp. WMMD1128]WFE36411.1 sugar phosphate nucleotidyltransferase [Micromonospora sp. WMMD975]